MKTKFTGGKFVKKYWESVFWLGPILSVAGLSAGAVAGIWVPVPIGLIIAGLVILGWWVVYRVSSTKGFWSLRSTEVSTNVLISTLSVIAILGLINFLGFRYFLRFDLTENQQLTLAPQSERVVRNLDRAVKIWLFSPQESATDVALLNNYQRLSGGNFSYEYVDLQAEPGLAEEFEVTALGEVYLETEDRRQLLQNLLPDGLSESTLTNRLAQLTTGAQPIAYFLQGHGERPLQAEAGGIAQATKALEEAGYGVEPLNLVQRSGVPDDAALVVVAGPTSKLFEPEVKALQAYLDGGGNLLIALDPRTDSGLQPLLEEWGIRTDDRIAIDPERWVEGVGPQAPLVIDYGEHPITQDFGENYSLYPLARSFEIQDVEGVDAAPLLFTSDESWAESNIDQEPEWKFDATEDGEIKVDRRGPLVLGVALNREVSAEAAQASAEAPEAEETETEIAEETEVTPEAETVELEEAIEEAEVTEDAAEPETPEAEEVTEAEETETEETEATEEAEVTEDAAEPETTPETETAQAETPEAEVTAPEVTETEETEATEEAEVTEDTAEPETTPETEAAEAETPEAEEAEAEVTETEETEATEEAEVTEDTVEPETTPETEAAEAETPEAEEAEAEVTETEETEATEEAEVTEDTAEPETTPETEAAEAETPEAEETTEAEVTEAEEATETETAEAEASEAEATPETAETQESRLIVLGDSDFFTNGLFGQVLNGDMFINSVNWLSQENEQLLSIRPREPNDRTLPITPQQARILIATIAIFPVMGLAASGVIWWSRR